MKIVILGILLAIFAVVTFISVLYNKKKNKAIHPVCYIIFLFIFSALLFGLFYSYTSNHKENIYQDDRNALSDKDSIDLKHVSTHEFKTIYGTLSAKVSNQDDGYFDVYLDNKLILTSFDVIIEHQIMLESHLILIMITDIGGSMGNTSRSLIDITPNESFTVELIPNSWDGTYFFKSHGCVYSKTHDLRRYADNTDYNLYQYCINSGGLSYPKHEFAKPDVYYEQKFSKFTSKQIYEQALSDGCAHNYELDDSNRCNGGSQYCFMFNSKSEKEDDVYTRVFKNFCVANNYYSADKNSHNTNNDISNTSGLSILGVSGSMHGGFVIVDVKNVNDYTGNYTVSNVLVNPVYHMLCIGATAYYNKNNEQYAMPDSQSCIPGDMSQWVEVNKDDFTYVIEQYAVKHQANQGQK